MEGQQSPCLTAQSPSAPVLHPACARLPAGQRTWLLALHANFHRVCAVGVVGGGADAVVQAGGGGLAGDLVQYYGQAGSFAAVLGAVRVLNCLAARLAQHLAHGLCSGIVERVIADCSEGQAGWLG